MTLSAAQRSTADRPLLGIVLMLGFCTFAPLADALAKYLGPSVPLLQIVIVRFLAQAAMFLPLAMWAGQILMPSTRILWLTFWRTLLHIAGISTMVLALRFLPLADAIAIAFVMPFIMLLLGKYVLGEAVGARRLIACAVGFLGTLMVVQPSFAEVGWPALLPLGVAVIFALFMLITRQIAKEIAPVALQAVSAMMALPMLVPLLLLGPGPGTPPALAWISISGAEAWILAALGIFGATGHLLMTWSLRYAPSATLAPMQYLEIPIATFFGWLLFRDLPNGLAAMGIALTIAAGLYIVARERRTARRS